MTSPELLRRLRTEEEAQREILAKYGWCNRCSNRRYLTRNLALPGEEAILAETSTPCPICNKEASDG